MNIAFFAQSAFFQSLQRLVQGWTTGFTPNRQTTTKSAPDRRQIAPVSIAKYSMNSGARAQKCTILRPLRVVRVVEAGHERSSVGRMVISGRMADVCAELDRLAAREAALS